jgi:hypothetical protein
MQERVFAKVRVGNDAGQGHLGMCSLGGPPCLALICRDGQSPMLWGIPLTGDDRFSLTRLRGDIVDFGPDWSPVPDLHTSRYEFDGRPGQHKPGSLLIGEEGPFAIALKSAPAAGQYYCMLKDGRVEYQHPSHVIAVTRWNLFLWDTKTPAIEIDALSAS